MLTPAHKPVRGSLLLEALVAIGVAAMFMTALLGFVVAANRSSDRALEIQQSIWNTSEGAEALKTITFASLTNTLTGSLSFASSVWSLGTSAPQTLTDGSTRTVKVEDVYRDASCNVVISGGTLDVDSKKITSTTSWTDTAGRLHTTSTTSIRTNWQNPQGSCFKPSQAGQVTFAVNDAQFYGGKQLRQLYFTNTGGSTVIIDKISFAWSQHDSELSQLFIDNIKVWSSTGPGTPSGEQHSVAALDIQNYTLAAGQTSQITKGQFSDSMSGSSLQMTVTFADGSIFTSPTFYPL